MKLIEVIVIQGYCWNKLCKKNFLLNKVLWFCNLIKAKEKKWGNLINFIWEQNGPMCCSRARNSNSNWVSKRICHSLLSLSLHFFTLSLSCWSFECVVCLNIVGSLFLSLSLASMTKLSYSCVCVFGCSVDEKRCSVNKKKQK